MAQRPTLTMPAAAPLGGRTETPIAIGGISVPDSKLAREMAEFVRETESLLLFHHSSRVYYWGALTGKRWGLRFDPEPLYAGAMFHDMGLTPEYASQHERFEVDGANCRARLSPGPRHRTAGHRYGVDGDCAAHDTRPPTAHASSHRARHRRRRNGRARHRFFRIHGCRA